MQSSTMQVVRSSPPKRVHARVIATSAYNSPYIRQPLHTTASTYNSPVFPRGCFLHQGKRGGSLLATAAFPLTCLDKFLLVGGRELRR